MSATKVENSGKTLAIANCAEEWGGGEVGFIDFYMYIAFER